MEKLILLFQHFFDDPLRVYLGFGFICIALIGWRVKETLKEEEERTKYRRKIAEELKERNLYEHKVS